LSKKKKGELFAHRRAGAGAGAAAPEPRLVKINGTKKLASRKY
jgi:hypothetical protein